jgi:pimeloyl-ACP methyl ester carboxylesterase
LAPNARLHAHDTFPRRIHGSKEAPVRRWRCGLLACIFLVAIACSGNAPSGAVSSNDAAPARTSTTFAPGQTGGYVKHEPGNKRVIIFVNGIFGDAQSTWQNKDGFYWPKELAKDPAFAGADVYVHSFNSPKLATAQQITTLATRLGAFLYETDHVLDTHQEAIFLCHSMGGLVTRAFLLNRRVDPATVPMIYFFATPTGGANVAEIAAKVSKNSQLRDMIPLARNGYLFDLMNQWLRTDLQYQPRIASYCAAELRNTGPVLVVNETSAYILCTREVVTIAADHMGIVKPASDRDDPYVFFKSAYERTFGREEAAIRQISAAQQPSLQPGEIQEQFLATATGPNLSIRRVKAVHYVEVDCEQTRDDDITLSVPLKTGERVLAVTPYFDKTSNLKEQHVALLSHDGGTAVVRYAIRGLDRTLAGLNCPGGGNAYIAATFVIQPASR